MKYRKKKITFRHQFLNYLDLTAIELKLLKVMSDNSGFIFNREKLMDHIDSDDRVVSDRTIDSHVKKTSQ